VKRKALFLFGAGASASSGAQPANPPLGRNLFAALEAARLVPDGLPPEILELFRTEPNFELGMQALAERYNDSRRYYPLLRGMARYFARFQPLPDSLYIRLFRDLIGRRARLCIATLNYENLIEHSLATLGIRSSVIKPHGSCSFLPALPPGLVLENVAAIGSAVDFEGLPITVDIDPGRIEQWCTDPRHDSLGPVMSFYAPDKPTKVNNEYIAQHRAHWAQSVAECDICFVVGVACNFGDPHVWDPLRTAKCRLVYVNSARDQFDEWTRKAGRRCAAHWPMTFEAAIPTMVSNAVGSRIWRW
jgi:hypothetical protein